jgi:pimeloyl-ACP methyl ester carboxylesterase
MAKLETTPEQPGADKLKRNVIPESRIHRFNPQNEQYRKRTTAIYGSGWGNANPELIHDTMLPMAEERPVILLDHPRAVRDKFISEGLEKYSREFPEHVRHLEKALNIIALIKQEGLGKVDYVAQSGDTVTALIAAMISPESFKNVVLISPAGMTGEDSFFKVAKRFLIDEGSQQANSPQGFWQANVKYVMGNLKAAVEEVNEIGNFSALDLVRQVQEKGVKVAIVAGAHDKVFPAEKIAKEIQKEKKKHEARLQQGSQKSVKKPFKHFYTLRMLHGGAMEHKAPQKVDRSTKAVATMIEEGISEEDAIKHVRDMKEKGASYEETVMVEGVPGRAINKILDLMNKDRDN